MSADSTPKNQPAECPCQNGEKPLSRRKFLGRLGWGAFLTTLAVAGAGTLRFFFPRVLFEPPASFKIGRALEFQGGDPDAHGVVSVSERFMEEQRIWVIREADRIYAVFAKCTHLGCTPRWFAEDRQFKCPCHGSKYYSNAVNFAGPAPRPMDRYAISELEDGRLLVDKSKIFTHKDFENPEAFVTV